MNKNEILNIVAARAKFSKKDTEILVDTFLEVIIEELAKGDKVVLSNFGTFEVRNRIARSGVHPRTGEPINIPASKNPAFLAGKMLKESLNK